MVMSDLKDDLERHFHRLGRELHNLVDRVTPLVEPLVNEEIDFSPRTDVVEMDGKLHIFMDLPGVTKEELLITLKDHRLTVRGERQLPTYSEAKVTRQERKGGFFSRSFHVGSETDRASVKAEFENGTLHITLPLPNGVSDDETEIPIT